MMHTGFNPIGLLVFGFAIFTKIIIPLLVVVGLVLLVIMLVKKSNNNQPQNDMLWQRLNSIEQRLAELERRLL